MTSTKQFVWCASERCETRDSTGALEAQFLKGGEIVSGVSYFFTGDHQRSVREVTSYSGAMEAVLEYDPVGRVLKVQGSMMPDFQYGSYYRHARSELDLARYRAYRDSLGRWINRDPLAEQGGPNLFAYVANRSINYTDPLGLDFGDVKSALLNLCSCLKDSKVEKCKEDSILIADALKNMFTDVMKGAPGPEGGPIPSDGSPRDPDGGDANHGWVCYQWANAIKTAIARTHQHTFSVTASAWAGVRDEGGAAQIHSAVNLVAGDWDICKCKVGFDHGKGFEFGMTHPGGVAPPSKDWLWFGDPGKMGSLGANTITGY